MRLALGLCFASFAIVGSVGCGGGNTSGDDASAPDGSDLPPPANGFQIRSPDIQLAAGEEVTYCYYTTLSSITQASGIKQWSSVMSPGSHHLIVFFTNTAQQPDGTLTKNCGFTGGGGTNFPIWSYSAQIPEQTMVMPDGIGMQVQPNQHLFVQMHYLNTDPNNGKTVHVTINGETYAPNTQYTPAAAFVTYSTDISIPGPSGTHGSNEHTCAPPANATFFTISTHSHRRSVHTWIEDGTSKVFDSTDWEHPGYTDWFASPHYQFSGQITYHCDYINDLDTTVTSGDSAATNEMCMAVGYFFPATQPKFCIDGFEF